jgi:C4-type Zn-finger protein
MLLVIQERLWKNVSVISRIIGMCYYVNKNTLIGGDKMSKVLSSEELMEYINNMDSENSVIQFSIPGKGRFTLVLQEEDNQSIVADVKKNPQLEKMFNESAEQYNNGHGITTSDLLKSLSIKDFR